jgi:hypothetical protein
VTGSREGARFIFVRFNAGMPSVTAVSTRTTTGVEARYELVSLPLYLAPQLHRLLGE